MTLALTVSCILLVSLPAQIQPVLVLGDGRAATGQSWTLAPDESIELQTRDDNDETQTVRIGKPVMLEVQAPTTSAQPDRSPIDLIVSVHLTDGQLLQGRLLPPDSPGTFRVEFDAFGTERIGFENVTRLDIVGRASPAPAATIAPEKPSVILANGDALSGKIKAIQPDAVVMESVFGDVETEMDRVAAIVWPADTPTTPAPDPEQWMITLTDGQTWYVDNLMPAGESGLALRSRGKTVDVAIARIRRLVFPGWQVRPLNTLPQPNIQTTPYLTGPVNVEIDPADAPRPRAIGGQAFLGGITTHPRSELSYPLGKKAGYLTGFVGLDPARGSKGHVDVKITAGSETLVEHADLTASSHPRRIALPLPPAADQLTMVTDFGRNAEIGDCVNWCEMQWVAPVDPEQP